MTTANVVSTNVIRSMFSHLVQSYSADEAREILIQKYPNQEGDILGLEAVDTEDNNVDLSVDTDTQAAQLAAAVTAKVAKVKAKPAKAAKAPKQPKAKKAKGASKMDRARELYTKAKDKSRGAMIAVFGKELGLSKAAASTYYYTVKK